MVVQDTLLTMLLPLLITYRCLEKWKFSELEVVIIITAKILTRNSMITMLLVIARLNISTTPMVSALLCIGGSVLLLTTAAALSALSTRTAAPTITTPPMPMVWLRLSKSNRHSNQRNPLTKVGGFL